MKKNLLLIILFVILFLKDFGQTTIIASNDTTICPGGTATLSATVTGGGYGTNSYSFVTVPFNFQPYSGGTAVDPSFTHCFYGANHDDCWAGPFNIGFPFCFLNKVYNQMYIGSNGWISFSLPLDSWDSYTPLPLPCNSASCPKNCIMAPWADWYPTYYSSNNVFFYVTGTAPNRKCVIYWNNCAMFDCVTLYGTFQIVLNEQTSIIENNITSKPACPTWVNNDATQGVQDSTGTVAFIAPGRNQSSWTAYNESTQFVPNGISWYTGGYPGGTIVGYGPSITVSPTVTTVYTAVVQLCDGTVAQDNVTVTMLNASFTYAGSPYCQTGSDPTPTVVYPGGTFTATPAGLVFLNTTTGTIDLSASTPGNYTITYAIIIPCPATSSNNITIVGAPTANAGANGSTCQGIGYTVSGATATNYNSLVWIHNGTGTLSNASTLTPTYYPGPSELGNVILTLTVYGNAPCGTATSQMTVNITPTTTADAGPDGIICGGSSFTVTGATATYYISLLWTTNGLGTLTNATTLNPTYTAGTGESGSVTLTLTANGTPPCSNAVDIMNLEISASATADAGKDTATCLGAPIQLTDSHAWHYVSLLWTTTGNGTFTDPFALHPWYTPGPYDLTTGHVNLTLYAYSGTSCPSDTNTMQLLIMSAAAANAGPDIASCGTSPVTISGSFATNYDSLLWSTSGTGHFNNSSILHPVYFPSQGDSVTGHVNLTLTAHAPEPCSSNSDHLELSLTRSIIAGAGPDGNTCQNLPFTVTGAFAQNYGSLLWTHNGSGSLSGSATLTPVYTPASGETGIITLTLSVLPLSPCTPFTDQMNLVIIPSPAIYAGNDTSICEGQTFHMNDAWVLHSLDINWTTSGDGTFTDPHILNPDYLPGASDLSSRQVILTLSASGIAPCNPSSDAMTLMITSLPKAEAGPGEVACQGSAFTVSGAGAENYNTVVWAHNGTGILTGGNTLTPTYSPATGETGTITLTLTAIGITPCNGSQVTDQTTIQYYQPVMAEAGTDQSISYGASTMLSGTPSGGSGEYSFDWQPASFLMDHTLQNPQTVPLNANMRFLLTIGDIVCGENISDSVRVIVGPKKNSEDCLIIHNVITPNGDGLNDKWIIECIDAYPENTVTIFNRWGENINSFENYDNSTEVWDGKNYKGESLPDGTYFYVLKLKEGGTYSGWVLLRSGSK
ncbi:MAG: gliding motility-associated C-terminal domain-containing protein [Bacteroidetes bacterium]|nr:gliding motility-associated C-terminal domain-containing protein [Bacteroidota bacterium]